MAGFGLVVTWEEWAKEHPPKVVTEKPVAPWAVCETYIEAVKSCDYHEISSDVCCTVIQFGDRFYVIPKG